MLARRVLKGRKEVVDEGSDGDALHDTVSAHEHLRVRRHGKLSSSLRNRLRCDASNALARRAARILDAPFQTSEKVVREGSWYVE